MKELSIEEKAKRYDEAIDKAKKELDACGSQDCDAARQIFRLFPELNVSKDERIRKRLIFDFKVLGKTEWGGLEVKDIVAWLEKQNLIMAKSPQLGKQKPFDYENANIQQKDFAPKETVKEAESNLTPLERKVKDILFSFHINAADGISFDGTMAIVHNLITLCQQEQKPADEVERKEMNIVGEDMTPFQKKVFCIIDTTIEEEQGLKQVCDELLALASNEIKQKPAWSEEDENILEAITYTVKNSGYSHCIGVSIKVMIDWLKSLKERIIE